MAERDYAAIARKYAKDVTEGRQPAGEMVRLQCQRFLDELKRAREKDFPYRFDAAKAGRFCTFVEKMHHTKGKWAAEKKPITLEPWQIWIFCVFFGWIRKKSGLRRFRKLFVVVPRKNGKSVIAATVGLYMLVADGEYGAEVYSGATNEKQANEVFVPARLMVKRQPAFAKRFGIEVNANSLVCYADNSKFEKLIGDPGDGQSPSCSIHDEYHEHADDGQVDTMWTGMGAREQPVQLIITTAGYRLDGPCYATILEEREKLKGIGHNGGPPLDDETLFVEYAADEEDDWKSAAALRKANPNMGVSVLEDYLLATQREAIRTPRKAAVFKTKHLNLWVAAKSAYFDIEKWRACVSKRIPHKPFEALRLEELRGRRCILALDLANKTDICALEYLFPPLGGLPTDGDPYIRVGRYFLPGDKIEDIESYQGWHAQDLLDVSEGNVTDFEDIEAALREAGQMFEVEHVAYDPWQCLQLAQRMMAEGLPMLEYRMTVQNLSSPMKELDALMRTAKIAHSGDPVMEWQVNNVVAQLDAKDNVYPRKPREEAKIDSPVALIMAIGVAMTKEEEMPPASPWDDPAYSLSGAAD